ncbi:MAG TPA: CusA/CzcA family heavy metal efflux RND transporter [Bryobacteraceae bacterium]|jgi:cobalt-zinc-cadmium resistance protein CzcA|nr:CusA/CzcA family heavy metal efflux RND transporter [Bryobacteraceae bacterium]
MIRHIVDFALRERLLVLAMGILLLIWGVISFIKLPVEAYPDVANNWVQVITQWPGRAAEEVEQQITIPIETQMSGLRDMTNLRSVSTFGLSIVTILFDDDANDLLSRQQVLEKLSQVNLPANVSPQLGPDYSPVGQIYWFTLTSTNPQYDLMELKSLEDWYVEKQLKSVPNVVDVSSFGGVTREYQVLVDPNKLVAYGLSIGQVEQALAANNVNAGGSFVEHGQQQFNIRAVGLMSDTADIGATVLKAQNGTPVRVRDVAVVTQGPKIRLGQIGKAIHREDGRIIDDPDVVEGVVLLRKGAEFDSTLDAIHEKVDELNSHLLPPGVKIVPHLDRSNLVHLTTHTVLHNLTEGILLVIGILFLFLGNIRSALIVALTIPFSLLFAAICLDLRHIPANLLSLGALDFGMVVDGSVIMVENILRHVGRSDERNLSIKEKIASAAHEVQRPVFYAIGIIIIAYVPIFTLQRVEGKLFRPMAWTVAFALLGALIFSMMLAPVLSSFIFRKQSNEWRNPALEWLTRIYRRQVQWCVRHRWITVGTAFSLLAAAVGLAVAGAVGSEFLPHLDEGAIWVRGTLASSTGPTEGERVANVARRILVSYPEVTQVVSQVGRPDDGTDYPGFFNTEYFVDLRPHDQWRPQFHQNKEELIAAMDRDLEKIPGALWNFSQPIADNMEEAVSGVRGQLAIKLYGDDLKILEATADKIVGVMRSIRGVEDLGVFRVVGQPNVNIRIDRAKSDRFGINVADVQDAVETAIGGKAVSQILKGERRYDLVVRYLPEYRRNIRDISDIRLLSPSGERVALDQLSTISVDDGASVIYRDNNSRYVAIKYSVRGRDLGSTVEEAMQRVQKSVKLPPGYKIDWAGEYASAKRAQRRLALIVPLTILVIYFVIYSAFDSFKWAALVLLTVATAPVGGIAALLITHNTFSVSSGVGFLALFGVSVQMGLIMMEYVNQMRARGLGIEEAAIQGAVRCFRPVMMAMLVAMLGLLPAAVSHGIGSDSQRPFAIVIVGGLVGVLFICVLLLPTLYVWFARPTDRVTDLGGAH